MSDVTNILAAIEQGDPHAAAALLPLVYDELRRLAAAQLAREKPGLTLDATALVHEAYLRLVKPVGGAATTNQAPYFDNRRHFFGAAAEAMRRILIDQARRKRRPKHGGGRKRVDLEDVLSAAESPWRDLLALDEALTRFTTEEPIKAELVKLRFFAGLTITQAAQTLGISQATAERYWAYARVWLFAELQDDKDAEKSEKNNPGR